MAFTLGHEDSHRDVGQNGSLLGYSGSMYAFPADDLTVIVLTNTSGQNAKAIGSALARKVLDLSPNPPPPAPAPFPVLTDEPVSAAERSKIGGTYVLKVVEGGYHDSFSQYRRTYRVFDENGAADDPSPWGLPRAASQAGEWRLRDTLLAADARHVRPARSGCTHAALDQFRSHLGRRPRRARRSKNLPCLHHTASRFGRDSAAALTDRLMDGSPSDGFASGAPGVRLSRRPRRPHEDSSFAAPGPGDIQRFGRPGFGRPEHLHKGQPRQGAEHQPLRGSAGLRFRQPGVRGHAQGSGHPQCGGRDRLGLVGFRIHQGRSARDRQSEPVAAGPADGEERPLPGVAAHLAGARVRSGQYHLRQGRHRVDRH